jgi:hypothetical protein
MAKIPNPNTPIVLAMAKMQPPLKTFEEVAAKLIEDNPQFKGFKQRTLSKQISNLNSGNNHWWLNEKNKSRRLIDSLCQLLEMEENLLHFLEDRSDRFNFPGFHALKPLNLKREDGWDIGTAKIDVGNQNTGYFETLDCWLSTTNSQTPNEKNIELLYVPDTTEFDLLSHKVAVGRHKHLKINRLSEVIDGKNLEYLRRHEPLILVTDEIDTGVTRAICANHKAPMLIISSAPFTCLYDELTALAANEAEKPTIPRVMLAGIPTAPLSDIPMVRSWTWCLKQNWRESLLTWVESRLKIDKESFENSKFSFMKIKELFDDDHTEQWFTTVREVLAICHEYYNGYRDGLRWNEKSNTGESGLALKLSKKIHGEEFKESYQALLKLRWQHCGIPFKGGIAQDAWNDLIKTAKKNDLPTSWTTFESLKKKGVITKVKQGYDFSDSYSMPLFLRNYLADALKEVLKENSIEILNLVCFDNQRRPFFDAALDSISSEALLKLVAQLNSPHKSQPRIGFNEALFLTIGRRLVRTDDFFKKNSNNAELLNLARNVRTMQQKYGTVAPYFPLSRTTINDAQKLEWITICWAWSQILPCDPDKVLFPEWLFPDCLSTKRKEPLEVKLPAWLSSRATYDDMSRFRDGLSYTMQNFILVATRLAPKLKEMLGIQTMPWSDVAFGMRMGQLNRSCEEGWGVVAYMWSGILHQGPLEDTLVKYASQKKISEIQKIAKLWWPSLVRHLREQVKPISPRYGYPDYFTSNSMLPNYSKLIIWVIANLDKESNLLSDLDDEDRDFLVRCPNSLPTFAKKQLLKWLYDKEKANQPKYLSLTDDTLIRFGNEIAQDLVMFLDIGARRNQAAKLLWFWQPVETRDKLIAGKLSNEALKELILESPSIAMDHVIELLVQLKRLLTPSEVRNWALEKLPDAGHNAGKLIELIHQANEEIKQADEKKVRLSTLH